MAAALVLGKADVSLFVDPVGTRVEVPHLSALNPSESREVAFRRFEGYEWPLMVRGEGRSRVVQLEATFTPAEHGQARALLDLLAFAADEAADGRLMIRTHTATVGGLDPLEVVGVGQWSDTPQRARLRVVTFTATRVHYTLGV